MNKILDKLGFDKKTLIRFFLIVSNSQIIYTFIAMKSVLYEPMVQALGVTNTEFGVLMGALGFIATFGSIAFGWIQDRFSIRKVLAVNSFFYGLFAIYIAVTPSNPFMILLLIFMGFGFTGDAFYWASVLKSVRSVAKEENQATAFGFMESLRGLWEFATNAIAVGIFTFLGSTILGMKVAMGFSGVLTIISALTIWFFIPEEVMIKSEQKTKVAFGGFIKAIKMPEVWLTGIAASCVYATFTGVNTYFVPYLQNVYFLPVALVGVFGLINGSVTRFTAGPIAGLVADLKFKSSAHLMKWCYIILVVLFSTALLIPQTPALVIPAMILLLAISIICFLIRGIYYAPIGEMGVPKEMSAAAMSVAAFIGYSPSFWAYPAYGFIIDSFGAEKGYQMIFVLLLVLAIVGSIMTTLIGRKIVKIRAK